MRYEVRFVGDDALPSGVDYAFARQDGETYLFVKRGAVETQADECDILSRAWNFWESQMPQEGPPRRTVRGHVNVARGVAALLLAGYGIGVVKLGSAVI